MVRLSGGRSKCICFMEKVRHLFDQRVKAIWFLMKQGTIYDLVEHVALTTIGHYHAHALQYQNLAHFSMGITVTGCISACSIAAD